MTKDEIIAAYMEQVKDQIKEYIKQDLSIDLDQDNDNDNESCSSKDNSMDSNNSFQIAGESQPIEKPEDILQSVLDTLKQKKHSEKDTMCSNYSRQMSASKWILHK
ncbi:hypothetical protein ACH5RR_030362 [Cinchona calisaya]|uniref:Uncharacterized protein n=1 Tax=Cinchona calisaya TaxID=153742 RepID=A0ABD2YVQ5_9GENT